jgi:hypothetical protein
MRWLSWPLLLAACAPISPLQAPVRVVGEGAPDLVVEHVCVGVERAPERALRVVEVEEWRALTARLGGALARTQVVEADLYDALLVVVPLPEGRRPAAVVVGTEEGVDVVTVDVKASAVPKGAPAVSLLRLRRAGRQLAVVVRDEARGAEQTLGVFLPR